MACGCWFAPFLGCLYILALDCVLACNAGRCCIPGIAVCRWRVPVRVPGLNLTLVLSLVVESLLVESLSIGLSVVSCLRS